jgi:glucose/arabinose dehydrogenase
MTGARKTAATCGLAAASVACVAALLLALAPEGRGDPGKAGDGRGGVRLQKIGSFQRPVYVHQPPAGADGLLFVVEQPGLVRVIEDGDLRSAPFLDIRGRVSCCDERGLLSIAFAPDYATSRRFYVYYTGKGGDIRVREYTRSEASPLRAEEGSGRAVIGIAHPRFPNHNGGQLQFGPDGNLYLGTGDGGSFGDPRERAQDKGSLLGKILRIDPVTGGKHHYRIPDANPYVKRRGRDEIFARGLRNPWRFSFDRKGRIVIGDVGQDAREEIDYETKRGANGANFGWDAFEGFRRYHPDASRRPKHHRKPIFDYGHGNGNCSISGGYVVRDPTLPSLLGRYVYADFCRGQVRSLIPRLHRGRDDKALDVDRKPQLSSFGEDAAGHVYLASLSGDVFRLAPAN